MGVPFVHIFQVTNLKLTFVYIYKHNLPATIVRYKYNFCFLGALAL